MNIKLYYYSALISFCIQPQEWTIELRENIVILDEHNLAVERARAERLRVEREAELERRARANQEEQRQLTEQRLALERLISHDRRQS